MGKKKDSGDNTSSFAEVILNEDHLASLSRIVKSKLKIEHNKKEAELQIKADVEVLASQLNVKPADINKVVATILKEEKKEGHISTESHFLDVAKQVIDG